MNMSRSTITAAALTISAALLTVPALSQDPGEVETLFLEGMRLEIEPMDVARADGVLTAPLFRLRYSLFPDPEARDPFRGITAGRHVVWIRDGELVPIHGLAYLSTDDALDALDGLIDPSFRLDGQSAGRFMSVLQAVMGPDQFDPVPGEAIRNEDNRWYFINGEFLSYFKGFVVTVDEQGAIADIDFELSMLDQGG
ncbi:hypothetical protein [Halomonas denitrificans]|nr:hypothetical protein [Halomonas denitrificans]